jgi:hypothetical protein
VGILIAIASLTASMMIMMLDTEEFFIGRGIETVIPQGERLSLEVLSDRAKDAPIAQGYSIVNGLLMEFLLILFLIIPWILPLPLVYLSQIILKILSI